MVVRGTAKALIVVGKFAETRFRTGLRVTKKPIIC
jgi:hypothetical protein